MNKRVSIETTWTTLVYSDGQLDNCSWGIGLEAAVAGVKMADIMMFAKLSILFIVGLGMAPVCKI
jgi:hypothetical protein